MKPQTRAVLSYLEVGSLTPLQAMRSIRCLRLASRIRELRMAGYKIVTESYKTSTGKRVARYSLVS
jgi:hypothetical protein